MCSKLRLQTNSGPVHVAPGDRIQFRPRGGELTEGRWGTDRGSPRLVGFARQETLQAKWLAHGWRTGTVPIADFAEGHDEIRWAGVHGDVACLYKGGDVVIVTRQANSAENRRLSHHRVPVQVINHKMVLPQKSGRPWID